MKKQYQITSQGKKELESELKVLIGKRGEIAEKIASARDFGDLTENAEYDAAQEERSLNEARIEEIQGILGNSDIIKSGVRSKVSLGSKVELKTGHKNFVYTVVGPVEADPVEGRISNESPIGAAIFGKKVGENAIINTNKGKVTYQIVNIC